MGRKSSNPKREIVPGRLSREKIEWLCEKVRYVGSPNHKKRQCKGYNFDPPGHYKNGSRCDEEGIIRLTEAQNFLKQGIRHSLVSARERGGYPLNIWCVDEKRNVWEAQLGGNGEYHGYLLAADNFRDMVLEVWGSKQSC